MAWPKMDRVSHEEYVRRQRERVVTVAEAMLARRLGIIEGSRELNSLGHEVAEHHDPDFMIFVVVDPDSDHLAFGMAREKWADYALVQKDDEIREMENFHREPVLRGCRRLIERFRQDP